MKFVFVIVLPPVSLLTVSVILYFSSCKYWCFGFFSVDDVPPPKLHFHLVGFSELLSVTATVNGAFPEVGNAENAVISFAISYFRYYDIHK